MAEPTDDATDDVTDEAATDAPDDVEEADVQAGADTGELGQTDALDPTDEAADPDEDDGAEPDEDDGAEPDEDDGAEPADGDEPTGATTKTPPFDPKADVEARRAATAARMDEAKGKTGGSAKPAGAMGKATAADPTGARAKRDAATSSTKKVARPSKRTGGVDPKVARKTAARSGNPKKAAAAAESTRYTAPIPRAQLESPTWVPVLMFTLLGVGGLVVLLTYVLWEGRPLALGAGLALILGGILTATQYR